MIEGLREPDAGTVTVAGLDALKDTVAVKRLIGVQLQTTSLFDYLTLRELLALFAAMYGGDTARRRVDELIALVNLDEKANARVNELSGGQKQRISIALALVNDPQLLFLDEPTTGLDPQARRSLWDLVLQLREAGKTIVLTTHYMEEAEILSDRVAIMDRGEIIACDTPLALVQALDQTATIRARTQRALDIDRLRSLPGAMDAQVVEDQLAIRTRDVQLTLGALLQVADELGLRLDNLTTSGANLEDVFLARTGRSLEV
jgi:ABC-2 type transport system ATP-binding protein